MPMLYFSLQNALKNIFRYRRGTNLPKQNTFARFREKSKCFAEEFKFCEPPLKMPPIFFFGESQNIVLGAMQR